MAVGGAYTDDYRAELEPSLRKRLSDAIASSFAEDVAIVLLNGHGHVLLGTMVEASEALHLAPRNGDAFDTLARGRPLATASVDGRRALLQLIDGRVLFVLLARAEIATAELERRAWPAAMRVKQVLRHVEHLPEITPASLRVLLGRFLARS